MFLLRVHMFICFVEVQESCNASHGLGEGIQNPQLRIPTRHRGVLGGRSNKIPHRCNSYLWSRSRRRNFNRVGWHCQRCVFGDVLAWRTPKGRFKRRARCATHNRECTLRRPRERKIWNNIFAQCGACQAGQRPCSWTCARVRTSCYQIFRSEAKI